MARPLDPTIDRAIAEATLALLRERGFARMSMEAVASVAGVGKPAIYRRFRGKAELVATVIEGQLPQLEVPDIGDTRAEQERHPELIEAFRRSVLLPRRAIAQAAIERGQARGDIRADIPSVAALDLLAGPLLARAFAGEDTGPQWRKRAFDTWWSLLRTPERNSP